MDTTLRFLHAGDLHLERPPGGLAEAADQLRPALADAAYRAAERVFDTAVKHHADFVVLAGDVVDPQASGPRGIVFLDEQFEKLAAAGIRVYWAGSSLDRFEHWAPQWPLPDNVRRFAVDRVEHVVHERAGEPLALVMGMSTMHQGRVPAAAFDTHASELFSVAVAHGSTGADSLSQRPVDYWALGGEHLRQSLLSGTVTVHYCGTPQGREPEETGPRGCTLVHVDDTRRVRTTFIPTDTVRYCDERITVEEATTREQLVALLDDRLDELLIDPFGPELLIRWTVLGSESLASELRSTKASTDLVARLRAEYGARRPAAWTVSLDAAPAAAATELYDEETLLGEFLRSARHYAEHPEDKLSLAGYLAERHLAGRLGALADLADADVRREVLAEATALGVDLLHPAGDRP